MTMSGELLEKYNTGVVSREQLADYAYKRDHPGLFRRRKSLGRAAQRWRKRVKQWVDVGWTLLLASLPFLRPPEGWSYRLILLPFTPFFIVGLAVWAVLFFLLLLLFIGSSLGRRPIIALLSYHRARYHANWREPPTAPAR